MTKRVSQFGRKWDERLPRTSIEWLMARVHVSTSDDDVAANIRERCVKAWKGHGLTTLETDRLIKQSIAFAIECHKRNQAFYMRVMGGGWGYTGR